MNCFSFFLSSKAQMVTVDHDKWRLNYAMDTLWIFMTDVGGEILHWIRPFQTTSQGYSRHEIVCLVYNVYLHEYYEHHLLW